MSRASTAPVISRSRSASVDFPWSMWAMMLRQRIRSSAVTIRPLSLIRVARPRHPTTFGTWVARVVVVGSANVDLVWHGERLPAPGRDRHRRRVRAGARAARARTRPPPRPRSAPRSHFVGCVGDDEHGRAIAADLEARGIDCSALATSADAPTGVALITVDARGENAIAVAPGANRPVTAERPLDVIRPGDVVLCSLEIPRRDRRGRGRRGRRRAARR